MNNYTELLSYCINPGCLQRENPEHLKFCRACNEPLWINDRYKLTSPLRKLEEVSNAEIFEIEDWESSGKTKVMKVLKPTKNLDLIRLFQQEAKVLNWLQHPGIPKVDTDGYFMLTLPNSNQKLHCLVMQKIEGVNLEEWINKNQPISQEVAIRWLREIIEILGFVHQHKVFHRDIKPSNIMLQPDGKLMLIDFGAIRRITPTLLLKLENKNVTRVISQGYTAPEQIDGEGIPKSDIFSLGRTFVYLLTGNDPTDFEDNETQAVVGWREYAHNISDSFADLIDEMMSVSLSHRIKNTKVILRRLDKIEFCGVTDLTKSEKVKFDQKNKGIFIDKLPKNGFFNLKWVSLTFIGIISIQLLSPQIASYLNDLGYNSYRNNQVVTAEFYWKLAIIFNPKLWIAHYSLGTACEDQQKFDCAETEYKKAIQSDDDQAASRAYNNLGHLYIIRDKKYAEAIQLLLKGLKRAEEVETKSSLHKNLGLAYLMQAEDAQAVSYLEKSITLDNRQEAYCLLYEIKSTRIDKSAAISDLQKCAK